MSKTAPIRPNSKSLTNRGSEQGESHPVPEHVIREFAGSLRLSEIHRVRARLMVITEIAEGLLAGELDCEWLDTLSEITRELSGEGTSPFVATLLSAIEQGKEHLSLLIRAANSALSLTINYTPSGPSDEVLEIDQLRLAVFKQRQKRRSELKTTRRQPAKTAKARATTLSVA